MKSSIKSYIKGIIILAFYFLISKRIKQNKEKDTPEDIKKKSVNKIKIIIPYYETNKGFLRKLKNNENKVAINITVNSKKVLVY